VGLMVDKVVQTFTRVLRIPLSIITQLMLLIHQANVTGIEGGPIRRISCTVTQVQFSKTIEAGGKKTNLLHTARNSVIMPELLTVGTNTCKWFERHGCAVINSDSKAG
jgi:hypothetical protein